jgi:hypothetical protein
MVLQAAAGVPVPIWSRAAIHDTVAAIVRQGAYRRDVSTTLLDRLLQWLAETFARMVQALGGVPHSRFVATVAAAIVGTLIVARVLYAARLRAPDSAVPATARWRASSTADPWREAEQLAAGGNFTEAAHALYRAALAMLAAAGLVRLHDSKTSGDYARELHRRGASPYASFRRFGARYDRIIYGTGSCDATQYSMLLDAARAVGMATGSARAA